MKMRALSILTVCGLIISSTAFAYMTPSQKANAAQDQYDQYHGKHAQTAGQVYGHLDQTKQDNLKSDEKQHRKNIQDQHKNTINNR